ncbi:MAG: tetratricopeptide repeat protein [Nitrospirota bacterium]|nr:tetratricopeptide repeat protein [Nitrospirota bacterium]
MFITAVIVALLPLVVLEVGLRVGGFHVPQDPFLSFGTVPEFFITKEIDGKLYYTVSRSDVYLERETIFPARKAPNTFRVICLGSSASAGWPHQGNEVYTAYLQEALQRAFPDRQIEVLNLGAHAYASYRNRLIFQEAIEFEPDAFVIWTGNNEFLEKRVYQTEQVWLEPVLAVANKSLLYRGLRGSRVGRWLFPGNTLSAYERAFGWFTVWSKIEQVALALRTNPEQFSAVKRHYESSVESMVEMAQDKGIPVVLATVPVNLREWRPTVSCHSGEGARLEQWQARYHEGRRRLLEGNYPSAIEALAASTELDPQYADGYFYLGKAFEAQKQFDRAYANYSLARDYDCNPFRAISAFNESIHQIAGRHSNVTLADLTGAFSAAAAPYAPGFDLFLDYVHPTKRGNLVAAESVFKALIEARLLTGSEASPRFTHVPKGTGPNKVPYDDWHDTVIQKRIIKYFMIQHQDDSIIQRSRYLLDTPELREQLTVEDRQFLEKAKALYSGIVASEQQWMAEKAPDPREQNKARLLEFYKNTFTGYEDYKQNRAY